MDKHKELVAEKLAQAAQEKVKIVLFGQPGAGKSSTINAICGKKVAATGNKTDTTTQAQIIEHGEVLFVDLPGYGTEQFPAEEFFARFQLGQYDLFLCVFQGKLHEADGEFFQTLVRLRKPCIFVRNKADEIYAEDQTYEMAQEEIIADLEHKVGKKGLDIVFISARKDILFGIDKLNQVIASKMDEARQEKYKMAVHSYSKEQLDQKQLACTAYIQKSSYLAAVNGLNPLLGVDIAVDVAILYKMFGTIREAFQISAEVILTSNVADEVKTYLRQGMTKEGIKLILKAVGKNLAIKSAVKYIPLLGQLVSAPLGYYLIKKAGEEYLAAAYAVAIDVLQQELAAHSAKEGQKHEAR